LLRDALSARVPMTVPRVSKLAQDLSVLVDREAECADLVLIYFPSLVRSLSLVAFSEPARSIKL
jgi:hypothetical protein